MTSFHHPLDQFDDGMIQTWLKIGLTNPPLGMCMNMPYNCYQRFMTGWDAEHILGEALYWNVLGRSPIFEDFIPEICYRIAAFLIPYCFDA